MFILQNRPNKFTTRYKSNGKQKLQTHLSQNYDFAFTNLLKRGRPVESVIESNIFLTHLIFAVSSFGN